MNKKRNKLSKDEISKKFTLPERKSKIALLTKSLTEEGEEYCYCRSTDVSRFMIACDSCEIWYHGDCVGVTERESKHIKQYYCDSCRNKNSALKTVSKGNPIRTEVQPRKRKYQTNKETNKYKKTKINAKNSRDKGNKRCENCACCKRQNNCGHCKSCLVSSGLCVAKQCTQQNNNKKKRKDSVSDSELGTAVYDNSKPRQCYGPECTKAALPTSKYCSEKCGLQLAHARIYHILPARLQERNSISSDSEKKYRNELADVRTRMVKISSALQVLDKKHRDLDNLIRHVRKLPVYDDEDDDQEDDGEIVMYCITCGHQIHTRTAMRHMEKCFNKYESKTSFCSIQKTRIEGNNMFCDFFNPTTRTYCKRLRVLCPEHYKEPRASDSLACGYPLIENVFQLSGEYCLLSKKKCLRHVSWEKLRRAEIDMERVRQWLRMDELLEKETRIRNSLLSRNGVLPLMLHSTYNHDTTSDVKSQSDSTENCELEEITIE